MNAPDKVTLQGDLLEQPAQDDDRFDWNSDDAPVVLQAQPRTAVYLNPRGQLVVRQERDWNMEEDSFIYMNAESAGAVVRELSLLIIEAGEDGLSIRGVRSLIAQFQRIERKLQEAAT